HRLVSTWVSLVEEKLESLLPWQCRSPCGLLTFSILQEAANGGPSLPFSHSSLVFPGRCMPNLWGYVCHFSNASKALQSERCMWTCRGGMGDRCGLALRRR